MRDLLSVWWLLALVANVLAVMATQMMMNSTQFAGRVFEDCCREVQHAPFLWTTSKSIVGQIRPELPGYEDVYSNVIFDAPPSTANRETIGGGTRSLFSRVTSGTFGTPKGFLSYLAFSSSLVLISSYEWYDN